MADAMDRYLIIRLSSLGDIIHTLPALAALRRHQPESRIAWVVGENGRAILDLTRGIDEVIVLGSPDWRSRVRSRDQVALDFQGLLKSALISWFSGSRRRIGFNRANLKEPLAGLFYTERLGPVPEEDHVIRKNLALLRAIGIDDDRIEFPLVIPDPLIEKARVLTGDLGLPPGRPFILINTGAAWASKRWRPEKWIGVAERLKACGLPMLLLWGNTDERAIADAVGRTTGVPLVPFLSLPEVMALIQAASLLISGDTFALQVACALSVPVVGIFGPTNPARNGPFRAEDRVAFREMDCSLCYKRDCPDLRCLEILTSKEVASLALERLGLHA
jgi:lipopolysaccharide heptosyltransferase I